MVVGSCPSVMVNPIETALSYARVNRTTLRENILHLGRFNVVIEALAAHFKQAQLPQKLEQCAGLLDQYSSGRTQPQLDAFRTAVEDLLNSSDILEADLAQPYARQVIADMNIGDLLPPTFQDAVKRTITEKSFDTTGLSAELRLMAASATKKTIHVAAIDQGFTALGVEYEKVESTSAEIGFLLPREVVGETLKDLTSEFNELSKLLRAVNELVAADEYDPHVLTISSSWWQVFLDLDPNQILVWVLAIERIVNLFKSNLEIKNLQHQLGDKKMPKEITDLIEKEVEKRMSNELKELASEIRRDYGKIDDTARLNEIETQLRQGLIYLARRMNQGAHVEINVGIPEEPTPAKGEAEGAKPSQEFLNNLADAKDRIAKLRDLRDRARSASSETTVIGQNAPLLLTQEPSPDSTAVVSKKRNE